MTHGLETSPRTLCIDLSKFDGAAFDLDGVITRTATVHAAAWKRMFDDFLQDRATRDRQTFRPFDIEADYRRYVDGKPRYDGVRDFLRSRNITMPDGTPDDPSGKETVCGLGNRKNLLFGELLDRMGVHVFDGSVSLLQHLREAGIRTAVVSASENAPAILAAAKLEELFDVRVDGIVAMRLGLKGKPAPDTFLHAAHALDIAPDRLLGVEDSLAGVEAIRAAGFGLVIGVDRSGQASALAKHGADMVVPDLGLVCLKARNGGIRPAALQECGASDPTFSGLPAEPGTQPEWVLVEEGFTLAREHEIESLFAIGNGNIGTRGSLAEGSRLSAPATFVAGVFDNPSGALPGLATVPDWTQLSIRVNGQALSLESGHNLHHRRILDLRQAIFFREWRQQDTAGRITRMREFRMASSADRRLLVQSFVFSPENYSGDLTVGAGIGTSMTRQTSTAVTVSVATKTRLIGPDQSWDLIDPTLPRTLAVHLGGVYRLERIVAVHTSHDSQAPETSSRNHVDRAVTVGLATLVENHRRTWMNHWNACDIRITGDTKAQRAVRFAMYHLLSAANPDNDRVSIGARALTGGSYRGHVFWDTDIFMLPFFTLTCPSAAQALLRYRHRTLPAARRRAVQFGYKGALFAWESADTGDDVTPPFVLQPDGEMVRVLTGEQEQHISADVAYGVWHYWHVTGDQEFLFGAGAEILVETARFWASRVTPQADGRNHIQGVIGPDEYHETVDDNAYTNAMAKWNLQAAARMAAQLSARWPRVWEALSARLGLDPQEPAEWLAVARDMYTGLDESTGLIEQFRGYFDLEDIDLAAFENRTAPMDVLLGRARLQGSQVIKQADVVMLLHLLWDDYPPQVRAKNFRYYEPRCAHGSSLSPAIHALIAARLGDTALAMRYLQQAIDIDLADNMGNAAGGVHAGALGGLWQAVMFGFAGLHFTDDGPGLRPHLPPQWAGLSTQLTWRGRSYETEVIGESTKISPGRFAHE